MRTQAIGMAGLLVLASATMHAADVQWSAVGAPKVTVSAEGPNAWKITSPAGGEYTLESNVSLTAKPGEAFEITIRRRLDLTTKAALELACFDDQDRRIDYAINQATVPEVASTNWQTVTRVFPVRPGTAKVRARVRVWGAGELHIADLRFRGVAVNTYQTGTLITQIYPNKRRGLILESDHGILNRGLLSKDDVDGDGKWAIIRVDLDRLSAPEEKGEDWRTSFEYRPNEIYWSEGAVLKSDSILADRPPSFERALHFQLAAHRGPYHAILNDPGRAVALSTDGKTWKRFEGGSEADLGILEMADGNAEIWIDACYRDPVSAGPVYFDYLRLIPTDHAPSVEGLFRAARQSPPRLSRGSAEHRRVPVTVEAPAFEQGAAWPVRAGLPIPQGELADAQHATIKDQTGKQLPSQNRVLATWPDGSVKWLYLDFTHDFSHAPKGTYFVEYGNSVRALSTPSPLQIESTASGVRVNTGALRFFVSKDRFGLIQQVSGAQASQAEPMAVEITEAAGPIWRALDVPIETLKVEQAGPLHAVILAETKLAASGKPAQGFYHRARIHVFANSPLVQIDYFVANTDSRRLIQVKSIAVKVHSTALVGVEAAEEQGPKSLKRDAGQITVNLWDGASENYDWIQGVGKTHKLSFFYGTSKGSTSLLDHGPVLALADPSWYADSGAFGPQVLASATALPQVEKTLAAHIEGPVIRNVGLGFENYGDHSSGGYVKGTRLWDNNEYDLPAGAMVHFVRTGNRDALRIGLASALHYLDVDTIHYDAKRPEWAGAQRVHSHGTFGHHTAAGPDMHHAGYVRGLILYSYFTGEPIGILGARGIANWILGKLDPDANVGGMERALGHPLMTLNDVYEATWEDRYLQGAAQLTDWALKWEHPVRGGFLAPITEAPAYYSGSSFCGGLLPSALLQFNGWAHLPEIDALLERTARWTLTDVWRPGGGIMSKGGSARRANAASPQNISSHMRLMYAEYQRTHDPLFLTVPYESMVKGFGPGAREIGTRSTGLVFNYLPWFFATLRDAGGPRPDEQLSITPSSPLELQKGSTGAACITIKNEGSEAVSGLRGSFQPRLDFRVTSAGAFPATLAPGQRAELCMQVQAPGQIGLNFETNRHSFAHWSFVFHRGNRPAMAYATSSVHLKD